jgi:hypothetical protein
VKEELDRKELQECTFKPKINPDYISNKTNKEKENNNLDNKKDRMVEMYEKGTADIKKGKIEQRMKWKSKPK